MAPPRSRRGQLLGNLLLAGTSLLLALLVAEVAFEVLDAHKRDKRSQRARPFYTWSVHTFAGHPVGSQRGLLKLMLHPLVGCVNLPDQTTQFFRINHLGFRGRELDPREQHRHRVVLVGGSAAFGTGLQSDAETLAVQLEQRLPDTEVVNAAVIGERSGQELSLLVSELVDLRPDQVMTLDGWNDFWAIQLSLDRVAWLDLNDRADVLQPDMFMDPIHLDARGNAAMADVLAPVVEAALRQFESRSISAPEHGQ
jgi:hypothetical protein